ncbi:hypothetical protein [Pseudidiomarina sp.]|uniref:hypothetical protein n=1 Tax=Pseudidiomarina sp. TaxID=2081707 RepID=UPI003A98683A
MSIRLLLTLLVFGLGGSECQSSSTPAWAKQTDTVISQVLAAEVSCSESTEHHDFDDDVLPPQATYLSSTGVVELLSTTAQPAFHCAISPQARAPPSLA